MSAPAQFAVYNLVPALVGGVVVWAVVAVGVRAFGVRHGKLRLCLFSTPLIKSTLLLLGIGLVFPWPRDFFVVLQLQALEPGRVLPYFMLFTGAAIVAQSALYARARRIALAGALPAETASPRLSAALDDVMERLVRCRAVLVDRCGCEPRLERPRLMVAGATLHSPLIATQGRPAIVFPGPLADRLDDQQVRGALAHEVAHLQLRAPFSCISSTFVQSFAIANPLAAMMAAQLRAEEEKACDDVAVAATGDVESYAGMLLEAYRYARPEPVGVAAALRRLPQLLAPRPVLAQRIERLVGSAPPGAGLSVQYAGFVVLWMVIIVLFFAA